MNFQTHLVADRKATLSMLWGGAICVLLIGCVNVANVAPCDADGDACTVGDVCKDKVCLAGSKKPCDDGELCTADSCDKASGNCVFDGAPQAGKT